MLINFAFEVDALARGRRRLPVTLHLWFFTLHNWQRMSNVPDSAVLSRLSFLCVFPAAALLIGTGVNPWACSPLVCRLISSQNYHSLSKIRPLRSLEERCSLGSHHYLSLRGHPYLQKYQNKIVAPPLNHSCQLYCIVFRQSAIVSYKASRRSALNEINYPPADYGNSCEVPFQNELFL